MTMTPGQGNAYVVLLASFLGHFIIMGMCYSMGVFYVEFREVFHDTKGSVALIASLSTAFLFQTGEFYVSFIYYNLKVIGSILRTIVNRHTWM